MKNYLIQRVRSVNTTIDEDTFYISYNNHDINIYGGVTTALVLGQMERFYILLGDHRLAYSKLINKGFRACKLYFKENDRYRSKYSDI